jgi:SAM-dependent methyltransferase
MAHAPSGAVPNPNEAGKFELQEQSYEFPYHYLADLEANGAIRTHRELAWGLTYMTYMSFVVGLVRELRPESLLDVGCGDGRLIHLVRTFVPRTAGVDPSARAIAFARAFNPEAELFAGDVAQIRAQYDVVTAVEVLEHVPDAEIPAFVSHLFRCTRPGGAVLISVPTLNRPVRKKHYRHYDLALLAQTLNPHGEIEKYRWLFRPGLGVRLIGAALSNRLFLLKPPALRRLLWRLHRATSYFADARTGTHLVALARHRRSG